MNLFDREYFTIILLFLLLIIIILSKKIINDNNFFYVIIILNLLIIISCLIDLVKKNTETFINFNQENKTCHNRSKQYDNYNYKIHTRLNDLRILEKKDRKIKKYEDEYLKNFEMANMNLDYLANGESFK